MPDAATCADRRRAVEGCRGCSHCRPRRLNPWPVAASRKGEEGGTDIDSTRAAACPRGPDASVSYPHCGALRPDQIGSTVRLSGWCHRIRDHGGVLFIDLRDHYGLTQVVADPDSPAFKTAEKLRSEWVVRVDGLVRRRPGSTENPDLPTGAVEVFATEIEVLGPAGELPMPVFGDQEYPEDIRLKYRFLDLRRERLHRNIMKRGAIIDSLRRRMKEQGFFEFQTPILTASSPEGARDFLVPSRHPSRQVLRAAAGAAAVQAAHHGVGLRPLFPDRAVLSRRGRPRRPLARRVLPARHRDELRHPGGRVRGGRAGAARRVRGIRRRQAGDAEVSAASPTPRRCAVRHRQARPAQPDRDGRRDRAFPRLRLQGVRRHDRGGPRGRGVGDPGAEGRQPRLLRPHEHWAKGEGLPGLGYIFWREGEEGGAGPLAKNIGVERSRARSRRAQLGPQRLGDAVFFVAGKPRRIFVKFAGAARAPRSAPTSA